MIRLGSLAGYPFEGPRVLAGWTPPATAAVWAICYQPDPEGRPGDHAVIDVDHAEDLSAVGFPFRHPRAGCWVERAGGRWKVLVCTYEVPGGLPSHREAIVRELAAVYRPGCHPTPVDPAWREEWIGAYRAPTTGPLTTAREPGSPPPR